MGLFIYYWFAYQYSYAVLASKIYANIGFPILGVSVVIGSLTIVTVISLIIGYLFFGKTKEELNMDKEIKAIKDKYRKLREIKRHKKRMKGLNNIPLEN